MTPTASAASTSVSSPGARRALRRCSSPCSERQARDAGALANTSAPATTKPIIAPSPAAGEATAMISEPISGPVTNPTSIRIASNA